jgi:ectoine hydroxylase-related dioxygenase (phytanoyl-CoA dioxygenase family)
MGGGVNQEHTMQDQHQMPDMVPVEVKAGSAFLFDTRLWHTTLPNTGDRERWCIITLYCPFYQKQPGPTVEAARALDVAGKLSTPVRQQLFGFEPQQGRNVFKLLEKHNGNDEDDRMYKGVRP